MSASGHAAGLIVVPDPDPSASRSAASSSRWNSTYQMRFRAESPSPGDGDSSGSEAYLADSAIALPLQQPTLCPIPGFAGSAPMVKSAFMGKCNMGGSTIRLGG